MIGRAVESLISAISPSWALQRASARATLDQINAISGTNGGYSSGKANRLTRGWSRSPMTENQVPRAQIDQLRASSWTLYRDNPYARKIVRTLESKVVGRGMSPQPLAIKADGTPHDAFRQRAKELWWAVQPCFDVRGLPGRGGLDMVELQKLALRSAVIGGNTFARVVSLTDREARRAGNPVRLQLQFIGQERLSPDTKADGFANGNEFYRGIEFNDRGRVAYHFYGPQFENTVVPVGDVQRVPAGEIIHLYNQDDVDQMQGVPWFSSALLQFRDTGDLQYNVLKASAIAACVVMGYKLSSGQKKLGLSAGDSGDLEDADGNRITKMQPGMMINLGSDGKIEGFSPAQPTTNVEGFIQHMLRGVGASVPGIKSSTITGDYRNSSFSSERSADNDCWPEMEGVQDWFAAAFCQPLWEQIVTNAFLSGWFTGVVDPDEFLNRRRELLDTHWQGPKPRSINPADDAKAAALRIACGQSSIQMECSAVNVDWRDVVRDNAEFVAEAEKQGLPEAWILASLGMAPAKAATASQTEGAPADGQQTSQAA